MRSRGTADSIFAAHLVDHLEARARRARLDGLSRATMSPVFCSVAKRPSSAPVRRDVPEISGVAAQDPLGDVHLPIGLRQRGAPGSEVVEHERALVHFRKEPGADEPVASTPATTSTIAPTSIRRVWCSAPASARS